MFHRPLPVKIKKVQLIAIEPESGRAQKEIAKSLLADSKPLDEY
jgi:hypothetical protein